MDRPHDPVRYGLWCREDLGRSALVTALLSVAMGITTAISSAAQTPANPLVGAWQLNLEKTRYGSSVDRRTQESFVCTQTGSDVRCAIQGTRSDGRRVTGEFTAALDGKVRTVSGIPDVDRVVLWAVGEGVVDATFEHRGKAVFAYRAFRSSDARSLSIVTVDPATRAVLNTLVVYDRR